MLLKVFNLIVFTKLASLCCVLEDPWVLLIRLIDLISFLLLFQYTREVIFENSTLKDFNRISRVLVSLNMQIVVCYYPPCAPPILIFYHESPSAYVRSI
jgi:hypothetical protein